MFLHVKSVKKPALPKQLGGHSGFNENRQCLATDTAFAVDLPRMHSSGIHTLRKSRTFCGLESWRHNQLMLEIMEVITRKMPQARAELSWVM